MKDRFTTTKKILSDLVAFPVLGGMSNLPIIEYIKDYLEGLGVSCHLVPNDDHSSANLHCRIGPATDGGIILSGHTDVVPVEGQDWSTDPFELTEKDGKLYGRGSCDMKGFLACCLASVPDMLRADLRKPIYLAFSFDEEVGCLQGDIIAGVIRDYYTETPRYAIVGEPSLLQPIVGQKGIIYCETTVHGSAGHSSGIRKEVSAIHEAARLIMWLESKMDMLIEEGYTNGRFEPDHTSIHVGIVEGGIAVNVVADTCTFKWDIRNIPEVSIRRVIDDFREYCRKREVVLRKKFPDARIETRDIHPVVPSLDTPDDCALAGMVGRLTGHAKVSTVSYASEAGQFSNAGFETVICGPGSIEQAHRADEFISVEQLEKGVGFIQNLLAEMSE